MSKNKEEDVEIRAPTATGRQGPMLVKEDGVKLDHPRKDLWKFLFSYLLPHKRKLYFYLILLLAGTAIMSFIPIMVANIIDNGIVAGNYQYVFLMTYLFFILMLFMGVSNYIATYGIGKASQNVVFKIRKDIFSKLQDMSLAYFDTRPSGDIISIATNDVDQLNQLVGGQFTLIITSIVSISLTIVFMYILNPLLATLSLVVFPIFLTMLKLFKKKITGAFKETRKSISKVTSSIQENIAGAKEIQAYGQEDKATSEFDEANKQNYEMMLRIRQVISTFFPLVAFVSTLITVSILTIGGFAVLGNVSILGITITVGVLSAFIIILSQFFRPFMTLMQIQQIIESALAATDRILSLLEEGVEIPDPENPEKLIDIKGEIQFNDVSFGYNVDDDNGDGKKSLKPAVPPMMAQNPMMKRIIETIKTYPEPYSSFMLKYSMIMPQEISNKLFMELMNVKPSQVPKIIDKVLAEFQYAVPKTKMAKKHPEYKTRFRGKPSMPGNPRMIMMMAKGLEMSLSNKPGLQSGGEMGGGVMGSIPSIEPKELARMLISMKVPPEVFDDFPKVVREYINDQKKLMEHELSSGYVLENVDFNIPTGTTLAIVGETGAGKTTMIKLISRFYDINKGSISIDGLDIRKVLKKELRDLIGLVPQDAFIFTGTIKENLLYAFEDITPEIEEKMIQISKFLGLHNFIETLHKKYEMKLKENGSNISIGQRQLIAFARALITNPKILILDEASSSVDPFSERLIQQGLEKSSQDRTTIIIAHRLSTIRNADRIIVLDNHKIVEEGNHEELINKNGKYAELIKYSQFNK